MEKPWARGGYAGVEWGSSVETRVCIHELKFEFWNFHLWRSFSVVAPFGFCWCYHVLFLDVAGLTEA